MVGSCSLVAGSCHFVVDHEGALAAPKAEDTHLLSHPTQIQYKGSPPSRSTMSSPGNEGCGPNESGGNPAKRNKTAPEAITKLRFSGPEPDLNVEVVWEDRAHVKQTSHLFVYSGFLRWASGYARASLDGGFAESRQNKVIFTGYPESVVIGALAHLASPYSGKPISVKSAIAYGRFYVQYEFLVGENLVDQFLATTLDDFRRNDSPPRDLDELVSLLLLLQQHVGDYKRTRAAANQYFKQIFCLSDHHNFGGPTMFDVEYVRAIKGYLAEQDEEIMLSYTMDIERADINCNLFPQYFRLSTTTKVRGNSSVLKINFDKYWQRSVEFDKETEPSDAWVQIDRMDFLQEEHSLYRNAYLQIERIGFGHPGWKLGILEAQMIDSKIMPHWSIVYYHSHPVDPDDSGDEREDDDVLDVRVAFWAPNSSHLSFPPTHHWVAANTPISGVLGMPRIQYCE